MIVSFYICFESVLISITEPKCEYTKGFKSQALRPLETQGPLSLVRRGRDLVASKLFCSTEQVGLYSSWEDMMPEIFAVRIDIQKGDGKKESEISKKDAHFSMTVEVIRRRVPACCQTRKDDPYSPSGSALVCRRVRMKNKLW
jgi:hypothetical protein